MSFLTTNGPVEAQSTILDDPRGKVLTIVVNLVVLTDLCVAMFFAAKQPDSLTKVFFKVFFGLLIPTLIGSAIAKRIFLRKKSG